MPLILEIENEGNYVLIDDDFPVYFLRDFEKKKISYMSNMPDPSKDISEIFSDVYVGRTEVGSGKDRHWTKYSVLSSSQLLQLIESEKKNKEKVIKFFEKRKRDEQIKLTSLQQLKEIFQQKSKS